MNISSHYSSLWCYCSNVLNLKMAWLRGKFKCSVYKMSPHVASLQFLSYSLLCDMRQKLKRNLETKLVDNNTEGKIYFALRATSNWLTSRQQSRIWTYDQGGAATPQAVHNSSGRHWHVFRKLSQVLCPRNYADVVSQAIPFPVPQHAVGLDCVTCGEHGHWWNLVVNFANIFTR